MTDLLQRLGSALEGRYRIERELGAGGMATVYLARDERHDRPVAIKVLRQELAASLGAERFHREIRIAAALQHPHVLPLYDSGDAGGLLYYVMPFVDGISLRQKLQKEGELPVAEAARILRDIADALTAAHDRGVIHRDLKPENVMLSGRHALVTDFGVAKAVSDATEVETLTSLGTALGTPAYMAPEQVSADPAVDHRADIYAFGVVAYELLAGRPPFRGGTPQETLAAHLSATPEPVETHRPGIPAPLAALVMQCLEKRPADRVQKAEDLIPLLETALTPSGEAAATVKRRFAGTRTRVSTRLIVGLIVLVGLPTGAAIWMPRGGDSLNPAMVSVAPFEPDSTAPGANVVAQQLQTAILQGLQRMGVVEVVEGSAALPSAALRLAREAKAGLVVAGRVLAVGDRIQVQPKLLSTRNGSEVVPFPPIGGTNAAALVHEATERVKGAVLLHRDPRLGADYPGTRAPMYEAYGEFQRANDHWNTRAFDSATVRFRRAFQLDTMFYAAALQVMNASRNMPGGCALVDSLVILLEPQRPHLSPSEGKILTREAAFCSGDLRTLDIASRELSRLAPASATAQYTAARTPLFLNNVTEARDLLFALDLESPQLATQAALYEDFTDVFHKLGDFHTELKWAREWQRARRTQQPIRARHREAIALVGLKRTAEVVEMFPQFLTTGVEGDTRDIQRGLFVIEELRWHGFNSVARDLSLSALSSLGHSFKPLERIALMTYGGNIEGASDVADSLSRAQPDDRVALRWIGMLAAARGNRTVADSVLQKLERVVPPYDRGGSMYTRAMILARLGEKGHATRLLQQAHRDGVNFARNGFHAQFGLEPLKDYPPFEAFVKPK